MEYSRFFIYLSVIAYIFSCAIHYYITRKINLDVDYNKLIELNRTFIDEDFYPNINSIFGQKKETIKSNHDLDFLMKITWKRPEDVFWRKYKLFGTIEPSILAQGSIGNCYFIAALSSLSRYPYLIKKLFVQKEINKSGVYVIVLYDSKVSAWREILIDEYLPVTNNLFLNDFAFTKSKDGSIWPHLLEKAFAKLKGSYLNMHGGYTYDSLKALTGATVKSFYHKNYYSNQIYELFDLIKSSIDNGYIICVCSYDQSEINNSLKNLGIISQHAYSVLDALHFYDDSNNPVYLIKLRNPHGTNEWKGDWSDRSEKWTSKRVKTEAKYNGDENDGLFLINIQDYKRFFKLTDITEYNEN